MSSTMNVIVYASDDVVSPALYDIILDPRQLSINAYKMIYFKSNWKSPADTFEISYGTLLTTCPKCGGNGSLDDISYNSLGGLAINRDENLLLQNLEKFTITESGSNIFHFYIGTNLVPLLGQKIYDIGLIRTRVTQEIMSSLDRFKELQQKYAASGRKMSQGETLETVNNILVTQDAKDATILRVDVEATAASGQQLTYSQLLKVG
jgi:hypothetical protein